MGVLGSASLGSGGGGSGNLGKKDRAGGGDTSMHVASLGDT